MNRTDIQWTWTQNADGSWTKGSTWNPLVGCRRISPGCGIPGAGSCYAERLVATRLRHLPQYKGLAVMKDNGPQFTGEHRILADRLDEPLRTRAGRRIFVNDLGDLFYEGHTNEEIAAVFGVMAAAGQHTFQVLTKRAKRMREWFAWAGAQNRYAGVDSDPASVCQCIGIDRYGLDVRHLAEAPWPLPNVWIGVTTEDRKRYAERVPELRACPAAVRFVSVEPQCEDMIGISLAGIDWVIQGGWSGPRAGAFDLAWARSMREQCRAESVAYFFKQAGANAWEDRIVLSDGKVYPVPMRRAMFTDSHGGNIDEFPPDLRVREFPGEAYPF